jgi:CheY-like chemotaxis protein
MDGIEAAQAIRALGTEYARGLPIIALTANAIAGNEQMFLDNGFQAFLPKPINIRRLDLIIRAHLMDEGAPTSPPPEAAPRPVESVRVEIPGVNARAGLALYDGDMGIYLDILRSFVEDIPAEVEKLRVVSRQALPAYAINVHTVKGAAASIGAKALSEAAAALEAMAKAGDISGVVAGNEGLIKDTYGLIADIRVWFLMRGKI